MLKLTKKGSTLSVETMGGKLTWDAAKGGQIVEFIAKNELEAHSMLPPGALLPDLRFIANGGPLRLADATAEMTIVKRFPDYLVIGTKATLAGGALEVTQEFEIHEEGALFCNMAVLTPGGKRVDLKDCSLNIGIRTGDAKSSRWGCFTREPKYKRDYSTLHAFVGFNLFRELGDGIDVRELYPFVSLDLGWESTRFFANHFEFLMEDWTEYKDGPKEQTRTVVKREGGDWSLRWHFHDGDTLPITGPYRYRNRWGMMFGRARTQSEADADPAVRNTLLGCRICHCMYPYARQGDTWPWVSMPIKQIAEQPPQLFVGNPELSRVDEAKAMGADTMIIHQFWMTNPGSNNEPIADYIPFDRKWLKAFVDRSHKKGMRVLFYGRGTEMWQMFSPFFEEFLEKDRDGLYIDWNTPFCMGYVKCSPLHVSAHNYFHFAKRMRARVGAGGALIGHTGNANQLAYATFDAAIGGEFSVRHDELLNRPDSTAYFAYLNCMGGHLISGNLPDRILFSSPKAAAVCAAFGMASHPFMEPGVTFADRVAFIKPLWDSLAALPGRPARLHNPAYIPTRAVSMGTEQLYPSLWQSDTGKALLLVTNLGAEAASGSVEVNFKELGLKKNAVIKPLAIEGTAPGTAAGNAATVSGLAANTFATFLIG